MPMPTEPTKPMSNEEEKRMRKWTIAIYRACNKTGSFSTSIVRGILDRFGEEERAAGRREQRAIDEKDGIRYSSLCNNCGIYPSFYPICKKCTGKEHNELKLEEAKAIFAELGLAITEFLEEENDDTTTEVIADLYDKKLNELESKRTGGNHE